MPWIKDNLNRAKDIAPLICLILVLPVLLGPGSPDASTSPASFEKLFPASFVEIMLIFGCIYIIPSIVAILRKHQYIVQIVIVNLFFGFTLVGWVGALIWAFWPQRNENVGNDIPPIIAPPTVNITFAAEGKPVVTVGTEPQTQSSSEQSSDHYDRGEPIASNAGPSWEDRRPAAPPADAALSSVRRQLEALEHLAKLRDISALNDAEFQAAKKKILEE